MTGPRASTPATGGNGLTRDLMAGVASLYATPLYPNIAPNGLHLEYASTILACLAFAVAIPVYLIYCKGPWLRAKSKFAQSLAADRMTKGGRRVTEATKEQLAPQNL